MAWFDVLVTRDATESCEVRVASRTSVAAEEEAVDKARHEGNDLPWECNEGNPHEYYVGDPGNSAEKVDIDDLVMYVMTLVRKNNEPGTEIVRVLAPCADAAIDWAHQQRRAIVKGPEINDGRRRDSACAVVTREEWNRRKSPAELAPARCLLLRSVLEDNDSAVIDLERLIVLAYSRSALENKSQMREVVLSEEVEKIITETMLKKLYGGAFPGYNATIRYLAALSETQMQALLTM